MRNNFTSEENIVSGSWSDEYPAQFKDNQTYMKCSDYCTRAYSLLLLSLLQVSLHDFDYQTTNKLSQSLRCLLHGALLSTTEHLFLCIRTSINVSHACWSIVFFIERDTQFCVLVEPLSDFWLKLIRLHTSSPILFCHKCQTTSRIGRIAPDFGQTLSYVLFNSPL